MNVLIVDDEEDIRDILSRTVSRLGFQAFEAPDGREAFDMVKNKKIDIVISDIKMPRYGGLELLLRMKKSYPNTPIALITADHDKITQQMALKNGADGYLKKPFNNANIAHLLKHLAKLSLSHNTNLQINK